ncbi:hypothetical protein AB7M49_004063 [Bradyrhizobium elkanii]
MADLLDNLRLAVLPREAEAFRHEVKEFLARELPFTPPDVRARSWMSFDAEFSRKLAGRGWVGATLPSQYGGDDLQAFNRFVLMEELLAVGAPVAAHWIAHRQSGPLILKYGTETQKPAARLTSCRAAAKRALSFVQPQQHQSLSKGQLRRYDFLPVRACSLICLGPLKLSRKAFWIGVPGAMKCQSMPVSLHQASMALQVNSVPLSETIELGLPRHATIVVSSRATRRPKIEMSGMAPRHSLVTSSTMWRTRKRRPLAN